MPARKATASGKWSQSIWDVTPGVGDDVFANGFTVEIDQNINVGSLRTTLSSGYAVAGGGFTLYQPLSVIASPNGILAGSTTCLTSYLSSGIVFLSGSLLGGPTFNSATTSSARNTGSGGLTIYGNVSGGTSQQCYGINNELDGNINVFGSVFGGSNNWSVGIWNASIGKVYVKGNVTGGSQFISNAADGISNRSVGTVLVDGNVYGGTGLNVPAIFQNSTGTVLVTGTITASISAHGVVSSNTAARNEFTGTLVNSISGRQAVYCAKYLVHPKMFDSAIVQAVDRSGTYVTYYAPEAYASSYVPHASSVRVGVGYAAVSTLSGAAVDIPTQLVGTMEVPDKRTVAAGEKVGTEIGTAILKADSLAKVWDLPQNEANQNGTIGQRLQNVLTIENFGNIIKETTI